VIDSPPEIAELAVDLHEHLIQTPTLLGKRRRRATLFFRIKPPEESSADRHPVGTLSWLARLTIGARACEMDQTTI